MEFSAYEILIIQEALILAIVYEERNCYLFPETKDFTSHRINNFRELQRKIKNK